MLFLHINMFFFYFIHIIFLLRRTRCVSDALKGLCGRFSICAPFCRKCLPFYFQFLSKMLMCSFFWSKKLSCIIMDFSTCTALFGFPLRPLRYYRSRSRNPGTFNMEHFPTLVSSFWVLTFVHLNCWRISGLLLIEWLGFFRWIAYFIT